MIPTLLLLLCIVQALGAIVLANLVKHVDHWGRQIADEVRRLGLGAE